MTTPIVEVDQHHPETDRPGVFLRTPYDERFVANLKDLIPYPGRAWAKDAKVWWVADEHRETAQLLMLNIWPQIRINGEDGGDYLLDRHGVVEMLETQIGMF